ncbi:MAG: peptide chain release factor 1 [Oligosphaeraceae bacterium]|nr:peptide chain release factor 1 [Oligosphaeraceae bacterium]
MNLSSFIDKALLRLHELEAAIAAFDFSSADQKRYHQLNQEYQKLKRLQTTWHDLQETRRELEECEGLKQESEDEEFMQLVEADLQRLYEQEKKLDGELKTLILPAHANEGKDIIIEIRPATGGDEAGLFAADLARMYLRYAEIKGWKSEIIESVETPLGGLKDCTFSLRGDEVWSMLHFESGVHRVQRVPSTETQGRVHTSTVTVAVMAEAAEVDLELKSEDLRVDVFRASGHGGQGVNTTDSAVRVTHIPSGLSVASQTERSQHRNKEIAMRILRARLLEEMQAAEDAKNAADRRSQVGSGERSERIRTYNFPQNRVSDHRYDITLYDLENIIQGEMDFLLSEIRSIDANRRLLEELNI